MSNRDEIGEAIVTIGLGAAAFAALTRAEKRRRFKIALAKTLADYNSEVVAAELGRKPDHSLVWQVALNNPQFGLKNYWVSLPATTDPYSQDTLKDLVQRLVAASARPNLAQ